MEDKKEQRRSGDVTECEIKKEKMISLRSLEDFPNDIVIVIISEVAARASRPLELFDVFLVCKRFKKLGFDPMVLSKVSPEGFTCKRRHWAWNSQALKYLKSCVSSGNLEANYALATLHHCLDDGNEDLAVAMFKQGADLGHAPSAYVLGLHFFQRNHSKMWKDLDLDRRICTRKGFKLVSQAAALYHIDAIREKAICLLEGIGVKKDKELALRLLFQANALEICPKKIKVPPSLDPVEMESWLSEYGLSPQLLNSDSPFITEVGFQVERREPHPTHLLALHVLRQCGLPVNTCHQCFLPELSFHGFYFCGTCPEVSYCSRACQIFHWKTTHRNQCVSTEENPATLKAIRVFSRIQTENLHGEYKAEDEDDSIEELEKLEEFFHGCMVANNGRRPLQGESVRPAFAGPE